MDLALTPAQEMLKSAVRRFVEQEYPKETLLKIAASEGGVAEEGWRKLAETGWLGILIPEEFGGEGGYFTDAGVLFEELGRGPVPGPHLSSGVLAALLILEGGTDVQKREWLPGIASGSQAYIAAVTESDYLWDEDDVQATARPEGDGWFIQGKKAFVFDGLSATHLLCAVRSDDSGQVGMVRIPVESPGVQVRPLAGFAWNLAEVSLTGVKVGPEDVVGGDFGKGWQALQQAISKTIPVLGAYQVGGCQAVYEVSVDYSRTRVQFSTPIGRFQRVQDHIINLVNQLDAARWTTNEALWKLDTDKPAADSIHLSKAVASEAYLRTCDNAHEVHAGVASMTEYGLTLHTTASRTLYTYLGDPRFHRRKLADALGL